MNLERGDLLGRLYRGAAAVAAGGALSIACWIGEWPGLAPLDEARVGFLYVSHANDYGWSYAHELGRQYLETHLEGVTTHYEASVSPAEARDVIERFIQQGDNVIVTTSYDFLGATLDAADAHPQVRFLHCSGFTTGRNYGSYFARMEQPLYLAGLVAGSMTRSNRIGYVGAIPIPETVRHINAFTLGVREANPSAVVHVEWVGNWSDQKLEAEIPHEQINAGADVIISGTDTTTPIETAAAHTAADGGPVYTIGYDNQNSCDSVVSALEVNPGAAGTCLTSAYWHWGPLYVELIGQMLEGRWDPREPLWVQMDATPERSVVDLDELSPRVPNEVRKLVDDKRKVLSTPGEPYIRMPFLGPIRDSEGNLEVPDGGKLDDPELLAMCWFVEGVIDADGSTAEVPPGCPGDYRDP